MIKENLLVSIIVPCYNQGIYLSEALQSVMDQTYFNWECIIVDDGSTDSTRKIAQEWCNIDKRYTYIYINNQGVSNARNIGISYAKGYYIIPLDSDDKLSINYVEEMISNFDKETKVVYGKLEVFGKVKGKWLLAEFNFEDLIFSNMIHCSGMFRIADFKSIKGYDSNMNEGYEDWEFWINLLKNGGKAKMIPSACLFYRRRQKSRMTNIDLQKRYRLIAYIYHKHSYLYNSYTENYLKNININFAYCFYLSAKMYNKGRVNELKKYYDFKLNSELNKYSFFHKKKILLNWFKKGKLNISFLDVLLK
ncbi:MAG: glycosyltransferase family A protein [Flavobacteriaceae bacterium]|nr:glycosyltransferase family A protein [Flavobacteriaceae bacterium]